MFTLLQSLRTSQYAQRIGCAVSRSLSGPPKPNEQSMNAIEKVMVIFGMITVGFTVKTVVQDMKHRQDRALKKYLENMEVVRAQNKVDEKKANFSDKSKVDFEQDQPSIRP